MLSCQHSFHPLISEHGISQLLREAASLDPEKIKIDDQSAANFLDFTGKLAQQVIHYDNSLIAKDWAPFFEGSTPFLAARIATINPEEVIAEYAKITALFNEDMQIDHLQWVIDFSYFEMIKPWLSWNQTLAPTESSLSLLIEKLIRGELSSGLKVFITLVNGASKYFGLRKPDFEGFLRDESWELDFSALFALDDSFIHAPGGVTGRILFLKDKFDGVFIRFFEALKIIQAHAASDNFLATDLFSPGEALEKQHPAHLGLFFTFLNLQEQFQNGLNELSRRHLDYFYQHVLGLKPIAPHPDQAHIILALQNHVDKFHLPQGTMLKDGKDLNKLDILFGLDEDIVVNKTQVVDLKTLFLNYVDLFAPCEPQIDDPLKNLTEGLYIAPTANSLNGLGEPFGDEGSKSWQSLGSKESKQFLPDTRTPIDHPYGRVGFVLASPVLLLNEGRRIITIKLDFEPISDSNIGALDFDKLNEVLQRDYYFVTRQTFKNASTEGLSAEASTTVQELLLEDTPYLLGTDPVFIGDPTVDGKLNSLIGFTAQDRDLIKKHLEKKQAFKINFSGEEEWITPSNVAINLIAPPPAASDYALEFIITLEADLPAVTFFDGEALEEKLDTDMPVLKIELDQDVKVVCERIKCEPDCCLGRCRPASQVELSVYEFLRDLKIKDSSISVEVCGIKNLIVQNDESVMDVNGLMLPFGSRPTVGSNFYVGSQEIFCKDWQSVYVNLNWKDLPADFSEYYNGYQDEDDPTDKIETTDFKVIFSLLEKGNWLEDSNLMDLYGPQDGAAFCVAHNPPFDFNFESNRSDFTLEARLLKDNFREGFTEYTVALREGFIRLTLLEQDFEHRRYPFVLARQMMAFGRYPTLIDGAVYEDAGGTPQVFDINIFFGDINDILLTQASNVITGAIQDILTTLSESIDDAFDSISTATSLNLNFGEITDQLQSFVAANIAALVSTYAGIPFDPTALTTDENAVYQEIRVIAKAILDLLENEFDNIGLDINGDPIESIQNILLQKLEQEIQAAITAVDNTGLFASLFGDKKVVIPNEPYTPTIKEISLDYTAQALASDIDLIHLYPYKDTYKVKDIQLDPTLLPVHDQEGTLFVGLEKIAPGANLNLLLQLAETTADTEVDQAEINWHYLTNNQWVKLREGFEILSDDTAGLTRSGIVKIAIPRDISLEKHTIMPDQLAWIKASVATDVEAVAEAIALHTQAVKATFVIEEGNDTSRLSVPLAGGSIAKLSEADASIKQVSQPYDTFNGKPSTGNFYRRVSEHLRHKGRGITAFDYERLVLESFPKVHLAKCIQHTFGLSAHQYQFDLELAPGFVLLAVIADPSNLVFEDRFAPKLPASELTRIKEFLKKAISPFVRLKIENPRYEGVKIKLQVQLHVGKDKLYHEEKLKQEIKRFLSPWVDGDLSELIFGRSISKSSLIKFIEGRDYVDYICSLEIIHAEVMDDDCLPPDLSCEDQDENNGGNPQANGSPIDLIAPKTARSILVAGEINICSSLDRPCETYHDDNGFNCDQSIAFHDCEKMNNNGCFEK